MLCVCKCIRKAMSKTDFENICHRRGEYCPKCGDKFELIEQPIMGVLVKVENNERNDETWITLKELKERLK